MTILVIAILFALIGVPYLAVTAPWILAWVLVGPIACTAAFVLLVAVAMANDANAERWPR